MLHITVRPGLFKINKKIKYNELTRTLKSLSWSNFLLGRPFKTEILTLEIVTCKLLLLKIPTISHFFQFGFVCGIFLLYHLISPFP